MHVCFWGTRGSLPASLTSAAVHSKIRKAMKAAGRARPVTTCRLNRMLRALPFAVRGAYGCNTSCVEITGGDAYILCDAGSGLRDFGQHIMDLVHRGKASFPATFHLFLSHFHWDHIQGFPFFTPAYIPGNRIFVYGGHADMRTPFDRQMTPPFFPVTLEAMEADLRFSTLETDRPHVIGGLTVRLIRQNHPGDSYGYRFECDGRSVVYTTDAEHKDNLDADYYPFVDFCRGADLIVMDAQYSLKDAFTIRENWGHSNNITAVELAVKAGIPRLCLYHSEHTCNDYLLDRFLKQTRRYAELHAEGKPPKVVMAYDGLKVKV